MTTNTTKGAISIDESALISIVKTAAEQVPGVIRLTSVGSYADTMAFMLGRSKSKPDSVRVKLNRTGLYVSVKIIISYGNNIHEIGLKVQMTIANSIKSIAQIEPSKIDVYIENVEDNISDQKLYKILEPIF